MGVMIIIIEYKGLNRHLNKVLGGPPASLFGAYQGTITYPSYA